MKKPFHVNTLKEKEEYKSFNKLSLEELKDELKKNKNQRSIEMIKYIIERKEIK